MQNNSNDTASRVNAIVERIGRRPDMLVPVLEAAQQEFKYLSEEVMKIIAEDMQISPAKVYGVATFYANFALEPKGKHLIRCCNGTACHVKGATAIMEGLMKKLGLKEGQMTTRDGMFSFEVVSCLGACGLAPVMVLDEAVHGQSTAKKATEVIDECIKEEGK